MYTPDPIKSQLIRKRGEKVAQVRSARGWNEYDVGQAAARGLADYLEQLSIVWRGGTKIRLQRVEAIYGDTSQVGQSARELPAANVIGTAREGDYEMRTFGGGGMNLEEVADTTTYLPPGIAEANAIKVWCWSPSTFSSDFDIEIHARNPVERSGILRMLEDDLNPVAWMNGFILELPHYHNVHAVYMARRRRLEDSPTDANRNSYKAYLPVMVHCPQIKLQETPQLLAIRRSLEIT